MHNGGNDSNQRNRCASTDLTLPSLARAGTVQYASYRPVRPRGPAAMRTPDVGWDGPMPSSLAVADPTQLKQSMGGAKRASPSRAGSTLVDANTLGV